MKPHTYVKGTNISNCLGPLGLAEDPWKTTLGEHKLMYGNFRTGVSGNGPTPSDKSKDRVRLDTDIEPVAYWGSQQVLWDELLHDFNMCGVIDCNAADGSAALASIEASIPYFGLAFTEAHAARLQQQLPPLELRR